MIKVIAPIDGSPAAKAGIEAGDFIVEVDGTPVRGMAVQKAIDKLRGEKGTSIKLTVFREGEDGPLDITVVRGTIQVSSVRSRIIEPGYGYVRVSQFQVSSGKDFKKELTLTQRKRTRPKRPYHRPAQQPRRTSASLS